MHRFQRQKHSLAIFVTRLICLFFSRSKMQACNQITYETMFYNFDSPSVLAMECLWKLWQVVQRLWAKHFYHRFIYFIILQVCKWLKDAQYPTYAYNSAFIFFNSLLFINT
jgi:hypothetical protein